MSWIVLGSILLTLFLLIKNVQPLWIQYLSFGISVALFVVTLFRSLPSPQNIKGWFQKRGLFIVLFIFLVILNILGRKYEQVIDVSQNKIYSLREKSTTWLKQVKEPVTILIFLTRDDKTSSYAEWLEKQMKHHTPFIRVEIKNINKEIMLAQKYEVRRTGETVLISGGGWVKVGNSREDILIPGLIRLLSKTTSSLCFLIGHGEPDIDDEGPEGLLYLKNYLSELGYKTKTISLDQSTPEEFKKECGVLLVVSPRTSFHSSEKAHLKELMQDHSFPLLFAIDPPVSPSVVKLLESEGVRQTGRLVIHRKNLAQKIPLTDIFLYPPPPIRGTPLETSLQKKLYFSHVQSLELDTTENVTWAPFLITPPNEPYELLEEEKKPGPFNLALWRSYQETPQQIVFGTGQFFQTRYITYGDNQRLILSTLRWLLQEKENVFWAAEREALERYMVLEENEIFWIKIFSLYGFPALAFLGTLIYWGKRHWRS